MATSGILVEDLSHLISQATAPAFMLGAMASLLAVLFGRLNRIIDLSSVPTAIRSLENAPTAEKPPVSSPTLRRRARLLGRAIEFTVISGAFTALLVLEGFASAFLGADQVFGAAILFMLAMAFFVLSLVCLLMEVRLAMRAYLGGP